MTISAHSFEIALNAEGFRDSRTPDGAVVVPPPTGADLLFASNFEGTVQFSAPYGCGGPSCWQDILGTDPTTGYNFQSSPMFTTSRNMTVVHQTQLIAGVDGINPTTMNNWCVNEVQTTTGRLGTQTRAARFQILQTAGQAQNVFRWVSDTPTAGTEHMYWRFWLRLESDLNAISQNGDWFGFWSWKTHGDDYRISSQIWKQSGKLIWILQGSWWDGSTWRMYFRLANTSVPVPQGQWFKVEAFFDRAGNGRVWQAINDVVVFDTRPPDTAVGEVWTPHSQSNLMGRNNAKIWQGTFHTIRAGRGARDIWLDEFAVLDGFPPG